MKVFKEDIQKLAEIYIKLKEIMVVLLDLEEKYPSIRSFTKHIHRTINLLDKVDHQVKQEAWELHLENKNKE